MKPRIICVDDEPRVLKGLRRRLGRDFDMSLAESGAEALELMRSLQPFHVIVSDMRMPVMNGAQLLATCRQEFPDTVRLLLTGQSDLDDAIAAINEGSIFRFLTKPCPPEILVSSIEAAVEHNRLIRSERELLDGTVKGSVALLAEILAIRDPAAAARGVRLKSHVGAISRAMDGRVAWDVEVAATLSEIGYTLVPNDVVDRWRSGKELNENEQRLIDGQWSVARDLVANIPRLETVAEILGALSPCAHAASDPHVRRSVEVIKAAGVYDGLLQSGHREGAAVARMRSTHPELPAEVMKALDGVAVASGGYITKSLGAADLVSGLILAEDLYASDGRLLLSEGTEVTPAARSRIGQYAGHVGIREPIRVRIPA